MDVGLLKNIILALMALAVIWIIVILAKRETENLLRAVLFLVFLGVVFYYLQHAGFERLTWSTFREDVGNTFFPEKMPNYPYEKEEGFLGGRSTVRYIFQIPPGPPLSLILDPGEKYFRIKDIHSVNRILRYLNLPPVKTAVSSLAATTGSPHDANVYRWTNYPLGVLSIECTICQDRDRLTSYQCIMQIILER